MTLRCAESYIQTVKIGARNSSLIAEALGSWDLANNIFPNDWAPPHTETSLDERLVYTTINIMASEQTGCLRGAGSPAACTATYSRECACGEFWQSTAGSNSPRSSWSGGGVGPPRWAIVPTLFPPVHHRPKGSCGSAPPLSKAAVFLASAPLSIRLEESDHRLSIRVIMKARERHSDEVVPRKS